MLLDADILKCHQKADAGCPKSQYRIANYYYRGVKVPENREKAKYYYALLASHPAGELNFFTGGYVCILALLGDMHFNDAELDKACYFFHKAIDFLYDNYPQKHAEKIIKKERFRNRLDRIARAHTYSGRFGNLHMIREKFLS